MLSRLTRHIATALAVLIGALGVLGVLYAWRLPPFAGDLHMTEDAYVRGQVTVLAPQLSGEIDEVLVQDFQRVARGDLLIRLDARSHEQRLAQARAALDAARAALSNVRQERLSAEARLRSSEAGLVSARAGLRVSQANLDRTRELKSRGIVTDRDAQEERLSHDRARAELDQASAQVEEARQSLASVDAERASLEASVRQAEAGVSLAEIDLDNTRITAPVDGRLGEVAGRVGQYVTPGTRLATLVSDRVWVVANFKETQLPGLRAGQGVTFGVDALGGAELAGRIERFSPATGSEFSVLGSANATGNFIKVAQRLPVRIAIVPGQPLAERLAPGMSVVVRVRAQEPPAGGSVAPVAEASDG